jgi:zinc/manganese transport system substrate-binding protein
MIKNVPIYTVWILLFMGSASIEAKVNVVTTTSDLASIAKEVGGPLIKVDALVKGYQDPHYIQPKPSYMVKMNRADLLIYQGLELEIGWLPVLLDGARNPNILWGQQGHLDASKNISKLELAEGELDRSMGDVHSLGNPHYHLNPENGLIIAKSIYDKLSELDAGNSHIYKKNLSRFQTKLKEKIISWKNSLKAYRGTQIVSYHKLWSYFAKYFNLVVIDTVETKPGVSPTTKHLAKLTALMNQHKIRVIIQANYYEPRFANLVAEKTESIVVRLPAFVGGTSEAKDYVSLFDTIIEELHKVLQSKH